MTSFTIDPDPPVAGQPVRITYSGKSDTVEWKVDGGTPTKVSIPPNEIEILSLPAGGSIWVNDGTGKPGGVDGWPIDNPTLRPH